MLTGSINLVKRWKHARELAMATAGNSRSSETDLTLAIKSMQEFWPAQEAGHDTNR